MKRWLWPVNIALAAALLLCTTLPVVTYKSRMAACGPTCDMHGYVWIFSIFLMLPVGAVALTVLGLTIARRKTGLVLGLLNALLAGTFATGLSAGAAPWQLIPIAVIALSSLAFCIAGLAWAPGPERIDKTPWPPHP